MFIASYKPIITNLKPIINKPNQEYNKSIVKNNFLQLRSDKVCFSGKKQEIIGKEVARTKITKIMPDNSKKDLDVIVALNSSYEGLIEWRKKIEYRIYAHDKKLLGHMRMDDTKINDFMHFSPRYGKNPDKSTKSNYIYLTCLESIDDNSYKGIGQKLIQLAIEQSIKNGHKGKVKLLSDQLGNGEFRELPSNYGCPTGFYYEKCHFRSDPGELPDIEIEEELKKVKFQGKHPSEANLNNIRMHLPEEEISDFWLPKINQNPIILSKSEVKNFEKTLAEES